MKIIIFLSILNSLVVAAALPPIDVKFCHVSLREIFWYINKNELINKQTVQ